MVWPDTYYGQYEKVTALNLSLNLFERLWAAWYAYVGNDVYATGMMAFTMHELVYFGRALPWYIIDKIPAMRKYKIQNQKIPTPQEQWQCTRWVLTCHFTIELPQIW